VAEQPGGRAASLIWDFRVLEIGKYLDGDTCELIVDQGFHVRSTQRFRLIGINAPERGTDDGRLATLYVRTWLETHLEHDQVRVTSRKDQTFNRWLGEVYSGSSSLAVDLLAAGLAFPRSR